jgi:hypothetical protein
MHARHDVLAVAPAAQRAGVPAGALRRALLLLLLQQVVAVEQRVPAGCASGQGRARAPAAGALQPLIRRQNHTHGRLASFARAGMHENRARHSLFCMSAS